MRAKKIGTWTTRVLAVGAALFVTFAVTVIVVVPRATHGVAMTVLTGSMTPTIPAGSLVVDVPVDPATLKVGDIATYQRTPGKAVYVTHRIVKVDTSTQPTTFTFKGDANRGTDLDPVPATALRGKVLLHVPYLGNVKDALHGSNGFMGVGFVLLVGYTLWQLASGLRDRKKARIAVSRWNGTLVAFPVNGFEDVSPNAVAHLFGGTLLSQDGETFTVFVPDEARKAQGVEEMLNQFKRIIVRTQPVVMVLQDSEETERASA